MSDPFSHYFDDSFNFSNRVRSSQSNQQSKSSRRELNDFNCGEGIMLEPRLQEYLRKRKHYKENGVEPSVPLKKEFQITEEDMKKLRAFFRGDNNLYDTKKYPLQDTDRKRKYFPSKEFKDDPKFPNFKQPAQEKIHNMGMFAPSSGEAYYDVEMMRTQSPIDIRDMMEGSYDQFLPMESLLDGYAHPTENIKLSPPCIRHKKTNEMWNPYQEYNYLPPLPGYDFPKQPEWNHESPPHLRQRAKDDDVNLETSIIHGMPHHTSKSYGYRNPSEHYYDYIDDTMQRPEHVIFPIPRGGIPTRLNNKHHRKVYRREIM